MLLFLKNPFPALLTILSLTLAYESRGQLQRFPADSPRVSDAGQGSPLGRTKELPPLQLPFFDDFSKPHGLYPDTLLWQSSSSVWVNDGMAIHPPTINVATFDGLSSSGRPYNPNEILQTGYTDTLMSRPIDLSEAALPVAERDGVYLSFFFQCQGNIEPPDERDFLELNFLTVDSTWETVMTIHPREDFDPTVFYDTIIKIEGERFFHDKFQFRLRAYGRLSGPFDVWHVDYVYLNKGRTISDLSFPDRALSTQLGPLFGKYRSMPRRHFFSNDQMTPPHFEVQNMKNALASVNFRTDGVFGHANRKEGIVLPPQETVISKATPVKITENVLAPYEHSLVRMDTLPDVNNPLQFPADPGIDSTFIRLRVSLQTRDNIPPEELGDYTPNYVPIRFTTNDTLTANYVLSDYFAYDDGVAEFAAGLIEAGNLVAYEFELDTTYALKQDTLIAFDVYFPPYAITSNQTVDFFIYHEDRDNPGLPGEQWLRIPSRRIQRKGLNEFQRIEFLPAILIDEKKFYIGWQEPAAGRVMVGLDISNDTGEKIFVNTNGFWYQNEDVRGSLMIRPVFGSGVIDTSVGIEDPVSATHIYPNPSDGRFFIAGKPEALRIFDMTGKPVSFQLLEHDLETEVRMETPVPGLYLLRYRTGPVWATQKIIIRP